MDFAYTPQQEALRSDVRQFIKENVTANVAAEMEGQDHPRGGGPKVNALFKKIHARGWLGIAYPKAYGGQGGDRISQYIVEEEFLRVGIPVGLGGSGAPAIMAAGTEEQKRYFIPKLISGEFSFALGFTEPSGGADLASLRCSAVRDGDYYVINGQKMYTSTAHASTHIYLMARTNRNVPKHEGISIFLIPMDTPASRCARCGRSRTIPRRHRARPTDTRAPTRRSTTTYACTSRASWARRTRAGAWAPWA
jgi:alkylation response protein AidB-like acyl-CoA dehydrogenase